MEKKTLLYLPHDLIIQILLRLPVKSLIRFKCVCRSWFSLISDPRFANSHFHLTSATHTRRIICLSYPFHQIQSIDFDAFLNYDPIPASLNIHFSLPQSYFPLDIRGSCRGFVFLYCRPHINLWNPSTGFRKQIPVSPFESKLIDRLGHMYGFMYGFGYDHSRDDYVVVLLSNDLSYAATSHLEFFSVRDNTWKETEGTDFAYFSDDVEGIFFNGAIHWVVVCRGLRRDVIVSFDLMERKLFKMPLPIDFDNVAIMHPMLWVCGEFLSVWVKDYDNDRAVIWVMKEYNVQSSWTKTIVLPLNVIPGRYFQPIYYTKNADIIGRNNGTGLMKYNDKGQLLGYHSFCDNPSKVVMYTESLLSLPGDNEQV